MRRILQSDVFKIFCYVAASLVMAAMISPWLYQLGKGLAEMTSGKQTNSAVRYVAEAAGRAEFPRFFDRSLMLSALVLLFPLTAWLKVGRRGSGRFRDTPWSLSRPDDEVVLDRGQPLERSAHGWQYLVVGFIVASGLLLLSGWLLVQAGCFMWRDAEASVRGTVNKVPQVVDWGKAATSALPRAFTVAVVEEVLFRGVLLGIFLRAMRAGPAVVLLSLLFAFVHFLQPPPQAKVPDPEAANAGFVLLGQIFSRFADPLNLLSRFSILAAVGLVLAYARGRTASLWLPVGLHAGWVFGMVIFKSATWPVAGLPEAVRWLVGMSLLEGLMPLSVVLVTGVLVHWMTRPQEKPADYRN